LPPPFNRNIRLNRSAFNAFLMKLATPSAAHDITPLNGNLLIN